MPRRPRFVLPGVVHHVTQRGNYRQPVFFSDEDRRLYLALIVEYAARYRTAIIGYCLMSNHVHLVAIPQEPNSLARTIGLAHAAYALTCNRSEQRTGHLWQGRFFSCPLDRTHLTVALRYVDLNPVRAGLIGTAWDWPWSSALAHVLREAADPVLHADWEQETGGWDYAGWRESLQSAAEDEGAVLRRATYTGEPFGSREFVERLERQAGRRLRILPRGRPRTQGEFLAENASVPFS